MNTYNTNKRICQILTERIYVANSTIERLTTREDLSSKSFYTSLQRLVRVLQRMKKYIEEISQYNNMQKITGAKSIEKLFKELCQEYDSAIISLNFALTVDFNLNAEKEVRVLKEDNIELVKFLKALEEGIIKQVDSINENIHYTRFQVESINENVHDTKNQVEIINRNVYVKKTEDDEFEEEVSLIVSKVKTTKNIMEKLLCDETKDSEQKNIINEMKNTMEEFLDKINNYKKLYQPIENEWIKKEHIKCYEYNQFSEVRKIGFSGFGKVYQAKWKKINLVALKAFEYENKEEIINEVIIIRMKHIFMKLLKMVKFYINIFFF